MIIIGQRIFSSLADGLLNRTPEAKRVLNIFSLQNLEFFLANFAFIGFLFDLIINRARKLRSRVESHHREYF